MDESQDSAAFTAECVTVDPSRAEYVQQVLSAARETLARSCGEEFQFRGRPADVPGAPERSRDRPLAARDRISSSPLNTQTPTWAEDRAAVLEAIRTWEQERAPILEAIRGLRRELCEALSDQLAELRWQQLGTSFDTSRSAYHALKQWCDAERSWIEEESLAKGGATAGDDRKMNNEPLEREPMNNEPLEREPIDRVRARSEALLKANAAPRCSTGFSSGCAGCVGSASRGGGGSRFWAWRFPTSTSNRKSSSSAALRTGDTKSFMLHPVRGSVPVTNAATQQ